MLDRPARHAFILADEPLENIRRVLAKRLRTSFVEGVDDLEFDPQARTYSGIVQYGSGNKNLHAAFKIAARDWKILEIKRGLNLLGAMHAFGEPRVE